jgi:ABC-type branched-subunit amino acid transport system ATPase component
METHAPHHATSSGEIAGQGADGRLRSHQHLTTTGIEVHFEGVKAIDGVDFTVAKGEILGLIGPNGAGKTTLVNVLTGHQRPTSGTVRLGDEDITRWGAPKRARAGLARTFQGARLFDRLSVFENIEAAAVASGLGRRAARKQTQELLEFFRLADVAERQAKTLPHGTARRLGVARALALGPSFLLLDEPAAGLAEDESIELVQMLKEVQRQYALGLVVIEHDVPLIMSLCERIHVLHHGETLAVGSPQEISEDADVIGAYLGETTQMGADLAEC